MAVHTRHEYQFVMSNLLPVIANYVAQTKKLAGIRSSTESTFYPDIKTLLSAVLKEHKLPFEARTSTSEAKGMPDFVLGDSAMFVGVYGEVKRENVTLEDLAISTEQMIRSAVIFRGRVL
jgi:hypothetical protein